MKARLSPSVLVTLITVVIVVGLVVVAPLVEDLKMPVVLAIVIAAGVMILALVVFIDELRTARRAGAGAGTALRRAVWNTVKFFVVAR